MPLGYLARVKFATDVENCLPPHWKLTHSNCELEKMHSKK